ncbi:MAG: 3,4-dihydroxy-2-butanone-4-phosphate synthase [Methanomassiliicoccaceae archaeon]|jgi:3,4-dihydroxy 2-butanone 4-phosphate synthase|nr:3,4-dihydroxy-2-butanone-4-phosphate synthase [Methanomassiliicoccaceae archaeon]
MCLNAAIDDIRNGRPVLVYDFDDREKETDMTVASQFITPEIIRTMRKDAGGLICTTTPFSIANELGLPFMSDVFRDDSGRYPLLKAMAPTDIPYDNTRSSFGVTINHRRTYTGITDHDRSLTITEYARTIFSEVPVNEKIRDLGKNFRAPGHVHLLNTSENILTTRKGHTELTTALMMMAGVHPSATICEMMGDDGNAMSKEEVIRYAEKNNCVFVEGKDIIESWKGRC